MAISNRTAQYQVDHRNLGFVLSNTVPVWKPKWKVDIGPNPFSSPVIGWDGTVYVGNLEEKLFAVNPDGTVKWTQTFPNCKILSAPAVSPTSTLYVITSDQVGDNSFRSTLHSVNPTNGNLFWSFDFPDGGHTTAAPKVWAPPPGEVMTQEHYIFVYVRDSGHGGVLQDNELFVLNLNGNVVGRMSVATCHTIFGGGLGLKEIWDFLSPGIPFDASGIDPFREWIEGSWWPDPTVAIVDDTSPSNDPTVVVADPCGLWGLRWHRPPFPSNQPGELEVLWSIDFGEEPARFCSPQSVPVILVRDDGLIQAFEVTTGNKVWEEDLDERVAGHPPASLLGGQFYIVTHEHIYLLEHNGIWQFRNQFARGYSAPVASSSGVYVSAWAGTFFFSFDLKTYSVDGQSSTLTTAPAVADDGTVYIVNWDTTNATFELWAYPGP